MKLSTKSLVPSAIGVVLLIAFGEYWPVMLAALVCFGVAASMCWREDHPAR